MSTLRPFLTMGLLIALVLPARAEPLANRFEGLWTCQSRSDGASFTWRVNLDLAGGWLTGEGVEDGRRMSLDVWAYDEGQRLQKRRQFTPGGALIDMDVTERTDDQLRLEGTITQRNGRRVLVRERIAFAAETRFDAVWEIDEGSGWRQVVDETCRKPE